MKVKGGRMDIRSTVAFCEVAAQELGPQFVAPYMRGKTKVRDVIYDETDLSFAEAEEVVDKMERNRLIEHRLVGTSPPRPIWRFNHRFK